LEIFMRVEKINIKFVLVGLFVDLLIIIMEIMKNSVIETINII